ncbi:hypothetical protein [Streptomyces massasporeus]|uniref:hypothetical protein n=1 Tax=Streptomyces massasporeus TaxID=67324 RepID=UPI00331711A6
MAQELPRLENAEAHARLVHRIYTDRRACAESRELLLAVAYASALAPAVPANRVLSHAARLLGRTSTGRSRLAELVAADAPRYERPREAGDWGPGQAPGCQAPRLRPYVYRPRRPAPATEAAVPLRQPPASPGARIPPGYVPPIDYRNSQGVCGADSHHKVLEHDPRTGWVTAHWFCRRHADHAERVAAQVREQNAVAPEPIPNRGGLLPSYFKTDWEEVYRHYAPASWSPPSYGLAADAWPTPGSSLPKRSRLRLITD